nr:hypothetical protein BaRGS_030014 [Batillaria attramentaria]
MGKEDEAGCDEYTCPGFYRCRDSKICVHANHTCDKVIQCPQHDDELLCDLTCPENCTCYGLAFFCNSFFPAAHFPELRFLDARGTDMTPADLKNNTMLIHLSLSQCELDVNVFSVFPNLQILNLSESGVERVVGEGFKSLSKLRVLDLRGCPMSMFPPSLLKGLTELNNVQTGICIPLPITRQEFPGHAYSFGVMIIFNFVLFVCIATGQVVIYWSIQANSMTAADTSKQSKDLTIARRLITVVVSDFLCWFPIGLLGVLASAGTPIPGEVNVVMAIVVLPVNSVLNPFLYTLNILLERRRRAREERVQAYLLSQWEKRNKEMTEDKMHVTYTEDEAWAMLIGWLAQGVLSPEQVEDQFSQIE